MHGYFEKGGLPSNANTSPNLLTGKLAVGNQEDEILDEYLEEATFKSAQ